MLGCIARQCVGVADSVLDFREAVQGLSDPGKCVSCYYRIYSAIDEKGADALGILRRWIEENLQVVARDGRENELERIPVRLEEESLEGYCHRIMSQILQDRAYDASAIELNFAYHDHFLTG